jgi:hypothetical protein
MSNPDTVEDILAYHHRQGELRALVRPIKPLVRIWFAKVKKTLGKQVLDKVAIDACSDLHHFPPYINKVLTSPPPSLHPFITPAMIKEAVSNELNEVVQELQSAKSILLYGDNMLAWLRALPAASNKMVHSLVNRCSPDRKVSDALDQEEKQKGISHYLQEEDYDVCVICLGTNDLASGESPQVVVGNLMKLIRILQKHPIQLGVFGFPFSRLASEELQRQLTDCKSNVSFLEFPLLNDSPRWVTDKTHLSAPGLEELGNRIVWFVDHI